jgi:membrane fusion protein, multidrug efflux system
MKFLAILAVIALICSCQLACQTRVGAKEQPQNEHHRIVVTSPIAKDVVITQQYVCQIRAQNQIEVCCLEGGRLERIPIKEGQFVKKGDLMFKIVPTLYRAKLDAELAEVEQVRLEYDNTRRLYNDKVVSEQELKLQYAKLAKAEARVRQAEAELSFTEVRAPFDGIIDRQEKQEGSTIKEGEVLTSLSDNSVMRVYFNVPEARYLRDMAELGQDCKKDCQPGLEALMAKLNSEARIELVLSNGMKFPQAGAIVTITAKFNNETGTIPYRADFPNPLRLLRHGQTGSVLIHETLRNAIVIPQRATYEVLDRRYVWVVDKDETVHQREIVVAKELEDVFVIKSGLSVDDRIVLEGGRQVHDGEKAHCEFRKPEEEMANQKKHAE